MSGALTVGGSGVAASATGSTGCASGGTDCCVVAHPTTRTAAIVVIRRCFICQRLSVPSLSCLRVCGVGRRFHLRHNPAVSTQAEH
ncbi:uncharacterized protein METZ01_LOCUS435563, partial [marine metagenome]